MTVTIANAGGSAQNRYAYFTLPTAKADTYGEVISCTGGATVNAYRHRILSTTPQLVPNGTVDTNKSIYVAKSNWASGNTSLTLAAGTPEENEFELHAAFGTSQCGTVLSWSPSMLPRVFKVLANGSEVELASTLRSVSPVMRIDGTHLKQAIWEVHEGGWHIRHAMLISTNQAVAEFSTSFLWSDEQFASDWRIPVAAIRIKYDYEVKLKFEANEGFTYSDSNRTITLSTTFLGASGTHQDRLSWDGYWYHGKRLAARGWMLGQVGGVVSADRTLFDNAAFLDGVASSAEWEGNWQFTGRVGIVPANPTEVVRPVYADTTHHYISWDRGTGGSDDFDAWSTGIVFARYQGTAGYAGNIDYQGGSQVIHGYQPLYDFEAAVADYGLRPRWVLRDGRRVEKTPASHPSHMALSSMYPHNGFVRWNFGRALSNSATRPPANSGSLGDGMDSEHFLVSSICAYYQLAPWDDFAYTLIVDLAYTHSINQRRGGIYALGNGSSGDREPGRLLTAAMQMGKVCPDLRGLMFDLCFNANGSFLASHKANLAYRQNPPTRAPFCKWMKFDTNGNSYNITDSRGNNFIAVSGPLWEIQSAVAFHHAYLLSGDPVAKQMAMEIGENCFLNGTVTLQVGYDIPSEYYGLTEQPGRQLTFYLASRADGYGPTPEQRVSGTVASPNADFDVLCGSIPAAGVGGDGFRGWAYQGTYWYANYGENPVAKSYAQESLRTLLRSQTVTTPRGWLQSNWRSWGDLTYKLAEVASKGFGWGD